MANLQHRWTVWGRDHAWTWQSWVRAVGATPLNNDNSVVHPAFATVNAEWGWTPPSGSITASVGVRNATHTAYSGWHQINGFGDKFYNPAPPRTWFLSVVWNVQ